MSTETPILPEALTHEEAVRRAKALAPRIRERALRCERERRVPRESIDEFVAAGLGRIMTPKRWGGYEMSHDVAADVILEISAACASTGWCCSFLLIHVWWFTAFPIEAQHDVYGDGPDVNLAASFAERGGTATAVDGGFRLSGRFKWTSGVDHCTWTMVGAHTLGAGAPHNRLFLLPQKDYRVEDTWYNAGLRGTGSNDVVVDDVFVPAYRTVGFEEVRKCTAPARQIVDGPVYKMPSRARNHELVAPMLGAARGALEDWLRWSRGRVSNYNGASFTDDAHRQLTTSHVEALLDAAELVMRRNLALVRNGGPFSDDVLSLIHASGGRSALWICEASDLLLRMAGASGLLDENSIQRAWRDVHAISMHGSLNAGVSGTERGRILLSAER